MSVRRSSGRKAASSASIATIEMLELARRHRPAVAERIGYDNVEFRKSRIQDLQPCSTSLIWSWSGRNG